MKKTAALLFPVALLCLAGCASGGTSSLAEMGCRTIDEYLPELDQAASGALTDAEMSGLNARAQEEIDLGYFDEETLSLYRLLVEPAADSADQGYTTVDIDYPDIRRRAIAYCESDVEWEMENS